MDDWGKNEKKIYNSDIYEAFTIPKKIVEISENAKVLRKLSTKNKLN